MGANPLMGGRFEMLQSYVQTPRQRETNFGKVVLKEVAGAFPKRDEFWDSCAQELDSSDVAFSVAVLLREGSVHLGSTAVHRGHHRLVSKPALHAETYH